METLQPERFTKPLLNLENHKEYSTHSQNKTCQPIGDHHSNIKLQKGWGTKDQRIALECSVTLITLLSLLRTPSPTVPTWGHSLDGEKLPEEWTLAELLGAEVMGGGLLWLYAGGCWGFPSLVSLNRAKGVTMVHRGPSLSTWVKQVVQIQRPGPNSAKTADHQASWQRWGRSKGKPSQSSGQGHVQQLLGRSMMNPRYRSKESIGVHICC